MSARMDSRAAVRTLWIILLVPLSGPAQERADVPPDPAPPALILPPPTEAPPTPGSVPPSPPAPATPPPDGQSAGVAPFSAGPFAAGPFGAGLGRDFRPSTYRAAYGVTWFPEAPVAGQNTTLGFVRQDFAATVPLWHDDCNDLAATVRVRNEVFDTGALLPNSTRPFPDQLWDVRFGGTYRHLFENGWIAGGGLGLGSSGDAPFEYTRDFTANVNGFLIIPQAERNYWLFTLSYSSNSDLPFPVPGVAFVWQPTDYFRAQFGLPFMVMYRPTDDLQFDASYMLLYTFRARATYRITPWLRAYVGYETGDEAYPLSDRTVDRDRLFYYDQEVVTGLQFPLGRQASLDLTGGYSFDRFYFEGQHLSDSTGNRLDVGDTLFLSLRFQTRW
jgi:hypothetical protein